MIGTQLYDKNSSKIYPVTDAKYVTSTARDTENSTVEDDIKFLLKEIDELTGSSGTVGGVEISIMYLRSNTSDVKEVQEIKEGWGGTFSIPNEKFPYTWKKTIFKSAGGANKKEFYEIAASDTSMVIQTIYTRTNTTAPVIEYKQKQDEEGRPLYIDEDGHETIEETSRKAYDYNFYSDGTPANKLSNLPPGGNDYKWTDYPQDISPSFYRVFMSRRIRREGKLEPFSSPAQYGQWPETEVES